MGKISQAKEKSRRPSTVPPVKKAYPGDTDKANASSVVGHASPTQDRSLGKTASGRLRTKSVFDRMFEQPFQPPTESCKTFPPIRGRLFLLSLYSRIGPGVAVKPTQSAAAWIRETLRLSTEMYCLDADECRLFYVIASTRS